MMKFRTNFNIGKYHIQSLHIMTLNSKYTFSVSEREVT
jgi:hypothetical protein